MTSNLNKLDNAEFTKNTATKLSEKFPGFNVMVFKTVGTTFMTPKLGVWTCKGGWKQEWAFQLL